MTALPRLADIEMYQRLYKTRPLSMGLPRLLLTSVLLPLLVALGGIRILFFCLFNAVYLALPARAWRLLTRPEWLYRLILFLTVGIIFRTPGFHPSAGRRQRLVVMNHHGVQDIFLFHFIEQVGVSRLVVSYPPAFYAWARRWFFFFDHDFEIVSAAQRRKIFSAGADDVTMVFPEGAGKKGPFVLAFQPAVFRIHAQVDPFAVSYSSAFALLDTYGVDLPWHKTVCFVLMIITPWTVVTARQLPTVRTDRDHPQDTANRCRQMIAAAAGYQMVDLLFDQRAFDACVGQPRTCAEP